MQSLTLLHQTTYLACRKLNRCQAEKKFTRNSKASGIRYSNVRTPSELITQKVEFDSKLTQKKQSYQATFLVRSTQCFLRGYSKLFVCRVILYSAGFPALGNHFIAYQLNICRNYLTKILNLRNSYQVFVVFSSFLKI